MLHSYMSVVYIYYSRGVLKINVWYDYFFLWIFVAEKATESTELQILCTQSVLLCGRIDDVFQAISLTAVIYLSNTLHV